MAVLLNMDALSKYLLERLESDPDKFHDFPKVCEQLEAGIPLPVVIKEILQVEKTETETIIIFNIGEKLKWLIGKEAKREEWEEQFQGASEKVWVVPENSQRPQEPACVGFSSASSRNAETHRQDAGTGERAASAHRVSTSLRLHL
jgi:hypothetical protein